MLAGKDPVATIAVKDLAVARKFYEGTLGLKVEDASGAEAQVYRSGSSRLIVYRSQFAGTNKATALNFRVGDAIGEIVSGLEKKGITFERYDFPDARHEGPLHIMGPMKVAWFKDPEGNIISVMNT